MTSMPTSFYGGNYVDAVETLQDKILRPNSTKFVEVDARSRTKGKVTFRDVAVLYGYRPKDNRYGICLHMNSYLNGMCNF